MMHKQRKTLEREDLEKFCMKLRKKTNKKTVQYFIAVLRVLQLSFKFVISHNLFLISKRTWNKHVSHWLFKLEYILRRKHYSIDLSLVAHPRATATEYYVLHSVLITYAYLELNY